MDQVAVLQVEIPCRQQLHDPRLVDALHRAIIEVNLCLTRGELKHRPDICASALPTVAILKVQPHSVSNAEPDDAAG